MAYLAAVAAHPAYTHRFQEDLAQPGLRIPLTADADLFRWAVEVGRRVVWLHTYGERFVDPAAGRPSGPPRVEAALAPHYPREGAIPTSPDAMPDTLEYDPVAQRLKVGSGFIENVPPEVWAYEVSGKAVIRHWFSYRRKNRERPLIGDRRPPSPLGDIQPDHWPASYTTDLIDLLHVLRALVELEQEQAKLLEKICAGALVGAEKVREAATDSEDPAGKKKPGRGRKAHPHQMHLLDPDPGA